MRARLQPGSPQHQIQGKVAVTTTSASRTAASAVVASAPILSHSRYITFQMEEVAIPRGLFADILRLIVELRAPPDLAPA